MKEWIRKHLRRLALWLNAACEEHISPTHAKCCVPRLRSIEVKHRYMRVVPIRNHYVVSAQHIVSDAPRQGCKKITCLSEWLPLHPCSAVQP